MTLKETDLLEKRGKFDKDKHANQTPKETDLLEKRGKLDKDKHANQDARHS